jgi:hypothetical protein
MIVNKLEIFNIKDFFLVIPAVCLNFGIINDVNSTWNVQLGANAQIIRVKQFCSFSSTQPIQLSKTWKHFSFENL